jgi:hypothetical protein
MTFHFLALSVSRAGARKRPPKNRAALHSARLHDDRSITNPACTNPSRIVAAWRVNPETGRLECTWVLDDTPGSEGGLSGMLERSGSCLQSIGRAA